VEYSIIKILSLGFPAELCRLWNVSVYNLNTDHIKTRLQRRAKSTFWLNNSTHIYFWKAVYVFYNIMKQTFNLNIWINTYNVHVLKLE